MCFWVIKVKGQGYRLHGMSSDALQVSRAHQAILYASLAWWGFATSADKQRILASRSQAQPVQRCRPLGVNVWRMLTMTLFCAVLTNSHHVLHHILPERTFHSYTLRPRRHDCTLTIKEDARNFVIV